MLAQDILGQGGDDVHNRQQGGPQKGRVRNGLCPVFARHGHRLPNSVIPPILATLGCATSTAPAASIQRRSLRLPRFSPAAIGMDEALSDGSQRVVGICGVQRLFEPGYIGSFELSANLDDLPGVCPETIRVDHEVDIGPDRSASGANDFHVVFMQLDVPIATADRRRRHPTYSLGSVASEETGVCSQRLSTGTAKQFPDRLSSSLACNVPQGNIKARKGKRDGAAPGHTLGAAG